MRAFTLPERVEDCQPKLQEWDRLIASGRADNFKETALLPDFLTDIFCGLLGYTGPVGPADTHSSHNSHNSHFTGTSPAGYLDTFPFSRERHVEVDGKVADAVPGRFQKDKEQFVAVLRLGIVASRQVVTTGQMAHQAVARQAKAGRPGRFCP